MGDEPSSDPKSNVLRSFTPRQSLFRCGQGAGTADGAFENADLMFARFGSETLKRGWQGFYKTYRIRCSGACGRMYDM